MQFDPQTGSAPAEQQVCSNTNVLHDVAYLPYHAESLFLATNVSCYGMHSFYLQSKPKYLAAMFTANLLP